MRSSVVSRPTLRDVLRSFAEHGLLVRRQGVGTFVATQLPVVEAGLEVLESLERPTDRLGLRTRMTHLRHRAPWRPTGSLPVSVATNPPVLVVDRVIGMKALRQTIKWMDGHWELSPHRRPQRRGPDRVPREDDLDDGFRGSVLDVLLARDAPALGLSRTQIHEPGAGRALRAASGCERCGPTLGVGGAALSYDERVVDYSISAFVPGYVEFHVMRQVRA